MKTEFIVPPHEFPATAKARQPVYETMIHAQQANNLAKGKQGLRQILWIYHNHPIRLC